MRSVIVVALFLVIATGVSDAKAVSLERASTTVGRMGVSSSRRSKKADKEARVVAASAATTTAPAPAVDHHHHAPTTVVPSQPVATVVAEKAEFGIPTSLRGPACILGGALAHLCLGSVYCWGNFNSYLPLHLRFFDGKDRPGQPDSTLVLPAYFLGQSLAMPLGPLILAKLGARNTMIFGSWLTAFSVYTASYVDNLSTFLMIYGFLFGVGVGIAYTPPMIAGWSWLPNSKGLVSGSILTGFGAGGFVFNKVGSGIVNPGSVDPNKEGKFPPEVYGNFPTMLRKLAMIYAVATFAGALLVTEAPKPVATSKSEDGKATGPPGVTLSDALKTNQFWIIWGMIITSASAGLNVSSMFKLFAAVKPALKGDSYQSLVGGLGALFNGLGRIFWGQVLDRIGFKTSFTALTILQAVVQILYPRSGDNKTFFLIMNCASYFCLAGIFAMVPPAVQKIFGPKYGALIYSIIYSAFGVASIGVSFLSKAMLASFGWDGVFKILASVSVVSTILTTFLKPLASLPSSTV